MCLQPPRLKICRTTAINRVHRVAKRQFKQSYNEDLMTPNFLEQEYEVHPTIYPCKYFLRAAGIYDEFYKLISNAGLGDFVANEQPQFENLTRIFVQSFRFNNSSYNPSVEFKLDNNPCKLSLK